MVQLFPSPILFFVLLILSVWYILLPKAPIFSSKSIGATLTTNIRNVPFYDNITGQSNSTLSDETYPFPRYNYSENDTFPTILILTLVKSCTEKRVIHFITNLNELYYPKSKISIGILHPGDSDMYCKSLIETNILPLSHYYNKLEIIYYDIPGFTVDPKRRQEYSIQTNRRRHIAKLRNYLMLYMLKNEDYILWIDFDVREYKYNTLVNLLSFDKDIIVPSCVVKYGGKNYDLNTWKITNEFRSYIKYYDIGRPVYQGYGRTGAAFPAELKSNDIGERQLEEMYCIGGTMILVHSRVIKAGVIFPDYVYKHYVETEGFSVMARDMGFISYCPPHIEIVHR